MENIRKAIRHLDRSMSERDQRSPIPFEEFLKILSEEPSAVIRDVFQVFHDMMKTYVNEGRDEYPNDPESINFIYYDCRKLFVEGSDNPFFADRLFANRLMNLVESLKRGAQQNKIYIFDGPPGCGKSTFLNNLLMKFEEYTNTESGSRFEAVWRLNRKVLGNFNEAIFEKMFQMMDQPVKDDDGFVRRHNMLHSSQESDEFFDEQTSPYLTEDYIEVPCPSHDHPILMIPKPYRRQFFDELFLNDEFKWKLFTDKEYDWVFKDNPCTILRSFPCMRRCRTG